MDPLPLFPTRFPRVQFRCPYVLLYDLYIIAPKTDATGYILIGKWKVLLDDESELRAARMAANARDEPRVKNENLFTESECLSEANPILQKYEICRMRSG